MDQIEIDIEELAKAKKRVWVKATATRKGHYREQEAGKEEEKSKRSFKLTPDYIRDMELDEIREQKEAVTVDSMRSLMDDIGLGESQGVGDHGIQVYDNFLGHTIDVKMNYAYEDRENAATRAKNANKIKAALDKARIRYTTATDVVMPGQVYFTIPVKS